MRAYFSQNSLRLPAATPKGPVIRVLASFFGEMRVIDSLPVDRRKRDRLLTRTRFPGRFRGPALRAGRGFLLLGPFPCLDGARSLDLAASAAAPRWKLKFAKPGWECFNLIIETGVLHEVGLRNTLEPDPDNTGVGSFPGPCGPSSSNRSVSSLVSWSSKTRGAHARSRSRRHGAHPI